MPLFVTLSARRPPRGFLRHRRGTQSCRYLRHFRHLALSHAIHGLPRAPNPVRIYDTFCTSAPGVTFPVEQGYAILSLFATFAAPGLLTRHSRIPEGTQSCAYLRHILHLRLGHRHLRNLRPFNLMHICYTFPRRRLSVEFGGKILGGFLPWSSFERRVVHMFLKFARAGCSAHQLRLGSHAIIYFFRKQHIVRLG